MERGRWQMHRGDGVLVCLCGRWTDGAWLMERVTDGAWQLISASDTYHTFCFVRTFELFVSRNVHINSPYCHSEK